MSEFLDQMLNARATKPTDSNCLRCGDPLFGLATALCEECFDEQQKEKKDSHFVGSEAGCGLGYAEPFKFAEWD